MRYACFLSLENIRRDRVCEALNTSLLTSETAVYFDLKKNKKTNEVFNVSSNSPLSPPPMPETDKRDQRITATPTKKKRGKKQNRIRKIKRGRQPALRTVWLQKDAFVKTAVQKQQKRSAGLSTKIQLREGDDEEFTDCECIFRNLVNADIKSRGR